MHAFSYADCSFLVELKPCNETDGSCRDVLLDEIPLCNGLESGVAGDAHEAANSAKAANTSGLGAPQVMSSAAKMLRRAP